MGKMVRKTLKETELEPNKALTKIGWTGHKSSKREDIVYALNRYNWLGNSRPLKTTFYLRPHIIIEPFFTTSLLEHLADKFRTLIPNKDNPGYISLGHDRF
jgi:hypothetical protein